MSSIFYSSPTAQLVERQASTRQIGCSSPTRNRILFYDRLCTVIVHCGFAKATLGNFLASFCFTFCYNDTTRKWWSRKWRIFSHLAPLFLVFFPKLAASFLGQMIARTLVSFARPNIFHAKQWHYCPNNWGYLFHCLVILAIFCYVKIT